MLVRKISKFPYVYVYKNRRIKFKLYMDILYYIYKIYIYNIHIYNIYIYIYIYIYNIRILCFISFIYNDIFIGWVSDNE